MVTHQLQVERRTGKVRRPETDVLPLCHSTNCATPTGYLYLFKLNVIQWVATAMRPLAVSTAATVAVRTGAFRVEMQRDAHQPRTIACRYDPSEPGTYVVQVMWSGAHVPGSPFRVHIGASRAELERLGADQQSQVDGLRAHSRQASRLHSD